MTHDLVVLGGGSAGYAAALRAVQLGMTVALVEADKLGGTCLHRGCIPTKALLHSAETADAVRESATVGVLSQFGGVDMPAVHRFKTSVVDRLHKGLQGLISARGVDLVRGRGTLVGADTVQVDGRTYTGRHVVLATGSYARTLPGLEIGGRVITSTEALEWQTVPARAVVLGGGVIGVEFASVWRSFGAEVTILEALPRLVPTEDEDLSKGLERAFRKRGINFHLNTRFAQALQQEDSVLVQTEDGRSVEADVLLVAVGRGPATAGLGFEEQGIALERGFVRTDERLHTGVGSIYAVGDIVPGLQLAHRGFQHGIFVAEEIAGLRPVPVPEAEIPRVTYCEPQLASVGLTAAQAAAAYGDDGIDVVSYNLAGNAKSQMLQTAGVVKLVRQTDGPIVGVHMLGARVGELIGEGQLMVGWEAYPDDVARLLHAHPTQNDAVGEAALALAGKPLHAHG